MALPASAFTGNVRPVSAEVQAEVIGLWLSNVGVFDRHARGAVCGQKEPVPPMAPDLTRSVAYEAMITRKHRELQALYGKIRMLHEYGIEPKYLAERFSLSIIRVRQILGLVDTGEGFE